MVIVLAAEPLGFVMVSSALNFGRITVPLEAVVGAAPEVVTVNEELVGTLATV